MNFRENLLNFLNEQKENVVTELTEKFEKEKNEFEEKQKNLRKTYLDGMDPNEFISLMNNLEKTCLDKKKLMNKKYNQFIGKGGHRHPMSWEWYLKSEIKAQTNQIDSLIKFVESEHFENSPYSRNSILENYSNLQEAENKLNTIRAVFPDDDNNDSY